MEEERAGLGREDRERWTSLLDRQTRELDDFDVGSTAMGLSAAEVAQASHDPGGAGAGTPSRAPSLASVAPGPPPGLGGAGDDERMSTQGSTLSLSASSSTHSFTSQTPL